MAVVEAAAVEQQRVFRLGAGGRNLVHDPAAHADELVLRCLSELGEFQLGQVEFGGLPEGGGKRHLERCGRREPCADWDVARHRGFQAAERDTGAAHRPGHARRVGHPTRERARRQVLDLELGGLVKVGGIDAHQSVRTPAEGEGDLQRHRHWEHHAFVVVHMAADQVHPARCPARPTWALAELSLKRRPGNVDGRTLFGGFCR